MKNTAQKIFPNQPQSQSQSQLNSATALLEASDHETSFFLATPHQTMLAQGIRDILPAQKGALAYPDLPKQAVALFDRQSQRGLSKLPLVGAIPFDDSANVHLFMPDRLHRAGPLRNDRNMSVAPKPKASASNACRLQMLPEPASYMEGVEQALEYIQQSELLKIVLSRSLELSFAQMPHLGELLNGLARSNRYGYTYLVNLARCQQSAPKQSFISEKQLASEKTLAPEKQSAFVKQLDSKNTHSFLQHSRHHLVGASPELLVRRRGMQVEANPLAGSAPRSGDPIIDQQRAEALMNSDKDRREHAVVVEAMAEALRPFCHDLAVPPTPDILQTDSMIHLSTYLQGTLKNSETCALSLALALHPTPAICGAPTQCAYSAIHAIEPFARRYFTGLVGWVDSQGDGEWAVTIRCGEAEGRHLRLYAGAGIVAGSTAAKELAETSAKFRTMLKALDLEHLLEARL
ncbi:isochorismate synthases subfamily [Synechococcus sp. PCC 7335]|uniref:isochorismate synthase n=1 Tax=Synechococcus sp. (strain ATCC 29403 / PCC 7335) TaxID=91464 RepID=UPI00017ED206|nr:isochorismate synthase [Synechococcus sp. PCC 7335]EDX87499.1 isochorismate synthases subfamily [Synechococcus sp. PCC 7335]